MTPTLLLALSLAVVAGIVLYMLRRSRDTQASRRFELGVVSTRWLSELRRDEPWTRS